MLEGYAKKKINEMKFTSCTDLDTLKLFQKMGGGAIKRAQEKKMERY